MIGGRGGRWAPIITCRDFWDVPRILLAEDGGQLFLFDCRFDEASEDFPDEYRVYLMPRLTEADVTGSWAGLHRRAVRELGTVPVDRVAFDPTRRREIDAAVLDGLTAPARSSD